MGTLELPEGVKFKILVDYTGTYSYHHDLVGLLYEDHLRLSHDLEKIAKMPLLRDTFYGDIPIVLGTNSYTGRTFLPFRRVRVQSSIEPAGRFGRLMCYTLEDEVYEILAREPQPMQEAIAEWYSDTTNEGKYGHLRHPVLNKTFSLETLDSL